MAKATIKTASVLAFERKLSNSDAMMYAGNWGKPTTGSLSSLKKKRCGHHLQPVEKCPGI